MKTILTNCPRTQLPPTAEVKKSQAGFTLIETAVTLVVMMIVGLGVASIFAYATNANSAATDRQMASAIAQKRMEWLRNIPFSATTRNLDYSYPDGGLGATADGGVSEIETRAGRTYMVVTSIEDTSVVPEGLPDEGEPTLKTITLTVTPSSGIALGSVTLSVQRSTLASGTF